MSNAGRFLKALTEIESYLRDESERNRHNDRHQEFKSLIMDSPRLASSQKVELKKSVDLRNAIVHDPGDDESKAIADPRESTVAWLENQVRIITKPPLVKDVLKLQPPEVLQDEDDVSSFLQLVREHDFSQSPVRTADGDLSLVTTNAVTRWLASKYEFASGALLESLTLRDLLLFAEEGDKVKISPKNLTAVQAVRIFSGESGGGTPAAIILTHDGSAKHKPLGICSRSDVAALLNALGV